MWKKLRKLVGGDAKAEAEQALQAAEADYESTVRQEADIDLLVSRIYAHGTENHIGERTLAGLTSNLADLARHRAKEA